MAKNIGTARLGPAKRREPGRPPSIGPEALIAATCELLRNVRPDRITIARVAREAGVDPKLIHYYFGNRDGLLGAAAANLSARFQADVASATGDTAEARLLARITALVRFQKAFPYFHRLMVEDILPSKDRSAHAALAHLSRRGIDAYRCILNDGAAEGRMRAVDAPMVYLAVIGMVEMMCNSDAILEAAGCEPIGREDFANRTGKFLADLLIQGLRPEGRRTASSAAT